MEESPDLHKLFTVQELVDLFAWHAVTSHVATYYICPAYKILLGDKVYFLQTCTATPLCFPTLIDSLLPTSPPTLDFFRSLTTEPSRDKVWAIYVLIIEKPDEKPKLGSGTNSLYGVRSRLANYNQHTLLPRFIDLAFRASYTITHRGLLCWAPIPSVTLVPSARLCFLHSKLCSVFSFCTHRGLLCWAPISPITLIPSS